MIKNSPAVLREMLVGEMLVGLLWPINAPLDWAIGAGQSREESLIFSAT